MFQPSLIRHPVKLKVVEVGRNVRDVVEARARKMLEATCSYVGYTKPGSLRLMHMGPGVLSGIDMGRHYTFQCTFAGEVCNPPPGTRLKAYVRSINKFGALLEAGYLDPMGTLVPVVEMVVIRDPTIAKNEVDLEELAVGDEVGVEVLGRRFELRDTRITGFARTVMDVGGGGEDVEERSIVLDDELSDAESGSGAADGSEAGGSDEEAADNDRGAIDDFDDLESFAGDDEALVDDADDASDAGDGGDGGLEGGIDDGGGM